MIFVTGANGLVGSFICRELLADDIEIRALKRKNSDLSLLDGFGDRIHWLEGDILDESLLHRHMAGAEAVIHCAAIVSFSKKEAVSMHKINVEGTANIVNACLLLNIPRLVHVSSIAAIGRGKKSGTIDEDSQWENSHLNSRYAISKYQAELEVWRGIGEGLRAVIVNPSIVLGPGNWENGSSRIFKYAWDANPFYPKGHMNFVDVRDVALIVRRLLKSDITGERFILNGGNISYKDVLSKIALHFNKRLPAIKTNRVLLIAAFLLDQLRSVATGKKTLINRETIRLSSRNFKYSNHKIRSALDYTFEDPEETLAWASHEYLKRV